MKKHNYKKLYHQIWNDRKIDDETGTYAICEETGQRIYESQLTVWNFQHIKSKGSHPELAYDPNNIRIVTAQVHGDEHCSGEFNNHLNL